MEIILASASPRRLELLSRLGLELTVCPAHINENIGITESFPLVRELSLKKAVSVFNGTSGVIAADTVVVMENEILGKPETAAQARLMWRKLSGKTHEVTTGYTIISPEGIQRTNHVTSSITFKKLTSDEIDAHLAAQQWHDKAGGYAIQGIAAFWIEKINGSYTNVMGLPLMEVARDLIEIFPEFGAFPLRK
ncbi:MAG: septum formation protein Maf [Deltaproteobacteria bacterium]|nr:septum formation protein Maf [Deltaproteobacteria bacterium]